MLCSGTGIVTLAQDSGFVIIFPQITLTSFGGYENVPSLLKQRPTERP